VARVLDDASSSGHPIHMRRVITMNAYQDDLHPSVSTLENVIAALRTGEQSHDTARIVRTGTSS
jgi:hypothetical protein